MDSDRKKTVHNILVSVPDYIQKVRCDTNNRTLPFKCAVNGCSNIFVSFEERNKYPYKFHNFPKEAGLCTVWKERCGLPEDTDIIELKVCSDHFSLDDYIRNYREEFSNPNFQRKLKPEAIPQMNVLPQVNSTNTDISIDGLTFSEIKEAVDENEQLKERHESLLKRKSYAEKKIEEYKKRIPFKAKEVQKCKQILEEDAKNKSIYKLEKNVVRNVFSPAQINLLLGKKRVFWSDDDLARAFTLRHIGSKECYLYLKNTLNMPLPALACVQKWAASYQESSS